MKNYTAVHMINLAFAGRIEPNKKTYQGGKMKEYQPCGEAWKKEMSRFTKREILDILAPKLIEMNEKIAELEKQVEGITKLRSALAGLVGVDEKEELEQMQMMIRLADAPAKNKVVTIDAIQALLDTI